MKVEIQNKIIELIAEQAGLNIDQFSLESNFQDLNIDSVGLVELVFSIEEYFEINLPFEELEEHEIKEKFSTVLSLTDTVTELLSKKQK